MWFAAADLHVWIDRGPLAPFALGTDSAVVQGAGRAAAEAAQGQSVVDSRGHVAPRLNGDKSPQFKIVGNGDLRAPGIMGRHPCEPFVDFCRQSP